MDIIERGTQGAEYIKADLHVHTPGSHDYEADVSPEDLINVFLEQGLELVAVTDHDCAGMYEELRAAAEGRSVEILPGVEITTPQGGENQIHMTAIFPPEEHDAVNHVLSQVGINPKRAGKEQANSRINDICEIVIKNNGLPILAHIDEPAGAHEETGPGRIREEIFDIEQVAAIEVVDPEVRSQYSEFPAIKCSDAHHPDQVGRGYTYLKMTEPSFSGLRTAFSDPDLRIAFNPPQNNHPHIEGIRCDGKFLNGREVQFNQNLNCLIGGKGTGKSTVIEHLRYAFDIKPRTERIQNDYSELIRETLGQDGELEVHIKTASGQRYAVSRQYGESPKILRQGSEGEDEEVEMDIETFRDEFFDLEIHSQGELLELARDDRNQLELIDSYLDFEGRKRERERIKAELRDNAQNLRSAREDWDRLKDELTEYEAVRENIAIIEEQGIDEYLQGEEKWGQEERRLNRFISQIQSATAAAEEMVIFDETPTEEGLDELPNADLMESARSDLLEAISDLEALKEQIINRLQEAKGSVIEKQEEWEERYEDRREEYEELADEIKDEVGVDVEKYFALKEEESRLKGVQNDLDEKEEEINKLERERQSLISELRDIRQQITDIRRQGINSINEELPDNVRVQLEPNSNKQRYIDWFSRVLRGSRVRNQDKEAIAEEYKPERLAQIVEAKDTDQLIKDTKITETAADNLVNHEDLQAQIHKLQTLEIHDRLIIEIRHQGEWKPLSKMSDGQQCTALLSIAMLERDQPLIIDQPEDMLDNEFIYDVVVDITKDVKRSRQIITATHNANIPILGDAEQMLIMWSNGSEGFFQDRGSIDMPRVQNKAQQILEGGKEAFSRRTRKYGVLE